MDKPVIADRKPRLIQLEAGLSLQGRAGGQDRNRRTLAGQLRSSEKSPRCENSRRAPQRSHSPPYQYRIGMLDEDRWRLFLWSARFSVQGQGIADTRAPSAQFRARSAALTLISISLASDMRRPLACTG